MADHKTDSPGQLEPGSQAVIQRAANLTDGSHCYHCHLWTFSDHSVHQLMLSFNWSRSACQRTWSASVDKLSILSPSSGVGQSTAIDSHKDALLKCKLKAVHRYSMLAAFWAFFFIQQTLSNVVSANLSQALIAQGRPLRSARRAVAIYTRWNSSFRLPHAISGNRVLVSMWPRKFLIGKIFSGLIEFGLSWTGWRLCHGKYGNASGWLIETDGW